MKRLFDFLVSFIAIMVLSPILLIFIALVFFQDFKNPFYFATRIGKSEEEFTMIKLRSMTIDADKSGVDSTANNDVRITAVGHIIRRYKIDELMQLVNVVLGDMSLVGPRPNVKRETDCYTSEEKRLLSVRPGITDISSIVFSDEGDILEGHEDPDLSYNQLIRPGKGFLGLLYIDNQSLNIDIQILYLTAIAILDKDKALAGVQKILIRLNGSKEIRNLAQRNTPLSPLPPPGATQIVQDRLSVPI